jgi:hypothetical protein
VNAYGDPYYSAFVATSPLLDTLLDLPGGFSGPTRADVASALAREFRISTHSLEIGGTDVLVGLVPGLDRLLATEVSGCFEVIDSDMHGQIVRDALSDLELDIAGVWQVRQLGRERCVGCRAPAGDRDPSQGEAVGVVGHARVPTGNRGGVAPLWWCGSAVVPL